MKTLNNRSTLKKTRLALHTRQYSVLLGLAVAGLSSAVNAATSFPDYPLQTHAGTVPPNIMFILDNSGSMNDLAMPDGLHYGGDFNHNGRRYSAYRDDERVYLSGRNLIAYDPMKKYEPWRNYDGTRKTLGLTPNAVLGNPNHSQEGIHGQEWVVDLTFQDRSHQDNSRRKNRKYTTDFLVMRNQGLDPLRYGSYYRYRYDFGRNTWRRAEWIGGANDGGWQLQWIDSDILWGEENGAYNSTVWGNWVDVATPLGVGGAVPDHGQDQLTNYAIWYSYHRVRMSVAKAGASEAFYRLGEDYRVGFDLIAHSGTPRWYWPNITSVVDDYAGAVMVPIPVSRDNGLFRAENKQNWFRYLHKAPAWQWTPLRQALYRTGNYYRTDNSVWTTNGSGSEYSCRRSYAILTTDGYWNGPGGSSNFEPAYAVGNADGTNSANYVASRPFMDAQSDTLADIAMHFWKTDLRPDLANEVGASIKNPATWQHMVTFGVSIGLQGNMAPNETTLAELRGGTRQWTNPITNGAGPRIDDLWHASVNSRGEFVVASDAESFANALKNALEAIAAENASGGGLGSDGAKIQSGGRIYQGGYESGTWLGDVRAFALNADGTTSGGHTWSFADNSINPSMAFANRPIFTSKGGGASGNGTAGLLSLGFLEASVVQLLARTTGTAQVTAADNLAYIRGDQSKEKNKGGSLRDRAKLVGDIVNSTPVHMNGALYVGANDGMLHAMSAVDGKPLFSYMPKGINFAALSDLSDPHYIHRFFVDGEIYVSDTTAGNGKNILVSPLGRGGKGMFALDVTQPGAFNVSNVLWDRTGNGDADIGYILSKPLVLKSNYGGRTVVVAPNGIENDSGRAVVLVYVLDAAGKVIGAPYRIGQVAGTGNGMMSVAAADIDQNGTVDYVYGGDLQGNVWKIDMNSNTPATWKVANSVGATPTPMFVATDANGQRQPITGGLSVAREPGTGRLFVSFGTGRFLNDGDKVATGNSVVQGQTLYSVIDEGGASINRSSLTQRSFPQHGTVAGRWVRSLENYAELPNNSRGWYLDLGVPDSHARGERIITAPRVVGRLQAVTTLIPRAASGCKPETDGALFMLDAFTGTAPRGGGFFDMDGDGAPDRVPGASQGSGYVGSVSTGIGLGGANILMKDDGSLVVMGGTYAGGQVMFNSLPGGGGSERMNWRELIRNN